MQKIKFFFVITTFFLAVSCSGDSKNRTSSEFLSAYMKDNSSVVVFGKIDVKQILEKAEYKTIPKVSVLLVNEMKDYESALDLSQSVHFAIEGPFEKGGNPANVVAFVKVKSAKALADKISSLGLMLQEDGDLKFTQDNEMSIGIKEDVAIFITRKGNYDGKSALKDAFEKSKNDLSEGKVKEILAEKGDIVFALSMQNLYASSNTSLSKLPKDKLKELENMANDSYVQSVISFEKGQAVFESKNLFSNALMDRMFFEEDSQSSILSKLGKGNARLGLALNMNMQKMESFLDDFAPDFKRELTKTSFQIQMAMSTLGDKPLSNLLSGKIGILMLGDLMKDGSLVPEANIHVGLGNKGKEVSEMLKAFFPNQTEIYGMTVNMNEKEITISSGKTNETKLNIPSFASTFGKKGFTAFVNFEGMDLESMDLEEGSKAIYAFKTITIEGDNAGMKMIVKGTDPNKNMLKQVVDVYVKDLEKTIGAIN